MAAATRHTAPDYLSRTQPQQLYTTSMPSTQPSSGSSSPASTSVDCPDCSSGTATNLVHDFASDDLVCGTCRMTIGSQILGASLLISAANLAHQNTSRDGSRSVSSSCSPESTPDAVRKRPPLRAAPASSLSSSSCSRAVVQRQERNITRAFASISSLCSTMDLPSSVSMAACQLYRRVEESSLHRGKNIDAIAATCIFLVCRQQGVPRTFKEICALTHVSRKDIGRTFKYLKDKLGADAPAGSAVSSDDLMGRFCANLSLLSTAQECAVMLNREAKRRDTLAGKSPVSVAGACIYMASHLVGQPREARVISHVAGVSEVTIKNSYKLLYKDRQHLVLGQMLEADPLASLDNLPVP
ncbi:transcription initiation factor IIB [Coemansia sp. Benny D115]|nr:transcription initiation factor IIB [Coemansia sp. Benny D115]